jgi:hypothetical protein
MQSLPKSPSSGLFDPMIDLTEDVEDCPGALQTSVRHLGIVARARRAIQGELTLSKGTPVLPKALQGYSSQFQVVYGEATLSQGKVELSKANHDCFLRWMTLRRPEQP